MNATARWYKEGAHQFDTPARVQHLRAPLDASSASAWATKRAIRVQIPLTDSAALIRKGWIVQFIGGNDPALENISATVQSAINSSHAAIRTVECISELATTPRGPEPEEP